MNRILAITLCAIMLVCAASCNQAGQDEIQTTQEQGQEADWSFLSDGERQTWEADLYDLLCAGKFYEEREYGCYGLALMDLNFDCVPEVLAAYRGGSMGNVFTTVHDLRTGEELYYYDAPIAQGERHLDLCVYAGQEGEYLTVGEGNMRPDGFSYHFIYELTPQIKMRSLFEEPLDEGFYYCNNSKVKKADYEMRKAHFDAYYTRIEQTQIQLIYWDDIDAQSKNEAVRAMIDALLGSPQQFLDFENS